MLTSLLFPFFMFIAILIVVTFIGLASSLWRRRLTPPQRKALAIAKICLARVDFEFVHWDHGKELDMSTREWKVADYVIRKARREIAFAHNELLIAEGNPLAKTHESLGRLYPRPSWSDYEVDATPGPREED